MSLNGIFRSCLCLYRMIQWSVMFIDIRLTIDCINCIQASKFWILNFYLKSLIMRWQIKKSIDDNMGFPMKILENKIDSEG